ncbi:MAG TPA: cytochrome c maturation protein CcmE [Stellaceae bacterium]|nr:cytochrome c maturation protein CcmE [Stellaceae bacterium]
MTRKRKRLYVVLGGLALLGVATALVLSAFSDNLVFFYGPSDLAAKHVPDDRYIRIGGLVENGSVKRESDGVTLDFRVTDGNTAVPVVYKGDVPDLFREGQGVVVEGKLEGGVFHAATVLAKHDENYMPPEVVDALKRAGHWQGEHPTQAAAQKP